MTILFPVLILLAVLISWPAYRLSRRRGPESRWLIFLAAPAVLVWLALTMLGFGAQSLSNIIEVIWLVAAGIVLAYLKILVQRRVPLSPRSVTYGLILLMVVAAIALRVFMPTLPE